MRLLDQRTLAKLSRLELVAHGVVEGMVSGRHRSPYKGFSVEFAEHRQYAPGDDIRSLDWKVYGKSDKYYIKQYIEETDLRAVILLDASGSMKYRGKAADKRDGAPLSKFEYGQYLAASLAHLLIHQQDAVGLVTFDTQVRHYIPPRGRPGHLRVILKELEETVPGDETALAPIFHDIAERIHRRGLIIVISDMFDDIDEILNAMHHFRYRRHEVIMLHLMADEEINFPFDRFSDFRNLEVSGHNVQLDPQSIRSAYIDEVRRFTEELKLGCGRMHIDYAPISTSQPFDVALSDYLAMRMGRYR
jgi:uncharacterized protein (DUF58 family)